jgi:hypothetical protein
LREKIKAIMGFHAKTQSLKEAKAARKSLLFVFSLEIKQGFTQKRKAVKNAKIHRHALLLSCLCVKKSKQWFHAKPAQRMLFTCRFSYLQASYNIYNDRTKPFF